MNPFPVNIFPSIEAPKVPNNVPRNPPSCLLIACFPISLTPSIIRNAQSDFFFCSYNTFSTQFSLNNTIYCRR